MPTIRDYMTTRLVLLSPDMSVHAARRLLVRHKISGAPVIDANGGVAGMLTGRDLLGAFVRASYHKDPGSRVEDCMTHPVQTLDVGTDIIEAIELFVHSPYRRFPVLDDARLVGLLSRHDVLRAIEDQW